VTQFRNDANLSALTAILLTDDINNRTILSAVTYGFGFRTRLRARSIEEALEFHRRRSIDLVIIDCSSPEQNTAVITRRFRREFKDEKARVPILAVAGHASELQIARLRDAGASFVIAKPISPDVMLKRILWLATDKRDFISTDTYLGPDRRVTSADLPSGIIKGRRSTDLNDLVSHVAGANLDQRTIDGMLKPTKVDVK
jgi:CheY-like chemotaxis protein